MEVVGGTVLPREGLTAADEVCVTMRVSDGNDRCASLLDGRDDFFATFIEVLEDRAQTRVSVRVDDDVTMGDCLCGFLHGTRTALSERGRLHLLITLERLDEASLGGLIALYERAVGLYAELVDINAYHQPAVESGKRAARAMLSLMHSIHEALKEPGAPRRARDLAKMLEREPQQVFAALRHMAAQPHWGVLCEREAGESILEARYRSADPG